MAEAKAITPGGGEAPSTVVKPHLDDGVVTDILRRLLTKDAYRLAAVCHRWREIISEPVFLSRHLSPRPLPLVGDDGPCTIILQPRRKVGYTHLTLVPTDPAADKVCLNLPLDPKYTSKSKEPRRGCVGKSKPPPPGPALLDTATDNFILSRVISAGDDVDEVCYDDDDGCHRCLVAAPSKKSLEDYVAFFERTVPALDISFVASHGRLLLARSRTRYFICDPAANRWLALPPPAFPPMKDTASGLHYDLDAAAGRVSFTVVLLTRVRGRRVRLETFSSATGRWDATTDLLGAQGAARRLPAASPGIFVGTSFYWLSQRPGHVVRYDASRGRASVIRDPPEAEDSKGRAWRSLGSPRGLLRLCAFDIRDEEGNNMLPHDGIEGVHGMWVMDAAGAWRRVHEAVVEDLSVYYFHMLFNHEMALDFAGASSDFVIVDKSRFLLRYDLETGDKVELASLYRDDGSLGALYASFDVFPFYRS